MWDCAECPEVDLLPRCLPGVIWAWPHPGSEVANTTYLIARALATTEGVNIQPLVATLKALLIVPDPEVQVEPVNINIRTHAAE